MSAEQKTLIAEKGYTVIAVLPEVTANADGQKEFAVELSDDAAHKKGAKLVWIAFPQNAQPSDDDDIADFYDAEGRAIDEVPAEKSITVDAWFRAGVTYQPVIAAEE